MKKRMKKKIIRNVKVFSLIFFPFLLILLQIFYGYWETVFPTEVSRRIVTEILLVIMSLGFTITPKSMDDKVKQFTASLLLMNLSMFIFGGFIAINDILEGTNVSGSSGIYFGLDSLSTTATDFTVIIDTIITLIPSVILIMGIIGMFVSSSPDEMQTAVIEAVVGLALLGIYGLMKAYIPI
jgi:hypothetical protein